MKSLEEMIKKYRKTADDCMKAIRDLSSKGVKSPAMVEVKEASEQLALWLEELQQFRAMMEELIEYIEFMREGASLEMSNVLDGVESRIRSFDRVMELVERIKADGCFNCTYEDCNALDAPCSKCKRNMLDRWEAKEWEEV